MTQPSMRELLLTSAAGFRAHAEYLDRLAAAEEVPQPAPAPVPDPVSAPPPVVTEPPPVPVEPPPVLVPPVQDPPAPTVELARLPLVGTGAPAGAVRETMTVLAQGDLPVGQTLAGTINGAAVPLQVDVSTRHPDGSACAVLLAFSDPGLAHEDRADLILTKVPQSTATVDTGLFYDELHVEVEFDGYRIPFFRPTSMWRDGPLSRCWREDFAVPAASVGANTVHVNIDLTMFADGSVRVLSNIRNDLSLVQPHALVPGGKVSGTSRKDVAVAARYSTRVLVGGVEVARRDNVVQPLGTWLPVEARVLPDGTPAPVPCWAFPDTARLHRVGVVGPYAPGGYLPAMRDAYVARMAAPDWDAPFALRGLVANMGMTGGRPDIGMVPEPSAIVLMGQDPAMAEYVLGRSVALMGAHWHWWMAEERSFLSPLDRPSLWLDPRDPKWLPGGAEATQFGLDVAHQPNDHLVAYLLTGDRHRLEAMAAMACWSLMVQSLGSTTGRGTPKNVTATPAGRAARLQQLVEGDGEGFLFVRADQVRAKSWNRRGMVQCAMLAPDAMQPAPGYFRAVLAANLRWLASKRPAWTVECGEVHGHAAPIKGDDASTFAPWQQDFGIAAEVQSVLMGLPGAMDHLRWEANWTVGSLQHNPAFYNADGVNYGILCGRPIKPDGKPTLSADELAAWDRIVGADVPMAQTWQQLGDVTRAWTRYPSYGTDFSAVKVDISGDYGLQRIIALTWMLHPGVPWTHEEREGIKAGLRFLLDTAPVKIFAQDRARVKVPHKNLARPAGV